MVGSTQNLSDIADFYGIFTYQDPLIYFGVENHDDWRHREAAMRFDPFLKNYINKLDEEIFAEKPLFTPDIFGGKQEQSLEEDTNEPQEGPIEIDAEDMSEQEVSSDVTEDWDNENWSALFTKFFNKSRGHSFSVVKLYNEVPYWRVYTPREITKIDYDEKNNPKHVWIEWSKQLPLSTKFITFREDFDLYTEKNQTADALLIPFGTPPNEEELGEYDMEALWTIAVYIRYSMLDIVNNSAKTSGFLWTKYGPAISPTTRQSFVNALDLASSSRGVGAKGTVIEDMTSMYPAKPEFTVLAMEEHVKQFAMASRLPLAYFRSESESNNILGGNQSGDETKINKKKLFLFGKFKSSIKTLIKMRWGIIIEDCEPFILETEEEEIEETPLDSENEKPIKNEKGE